MHPLEGSYFIAKVIGGMPRYNPNNSGATIYPIPFPLSPGSTTFLPPDFKHDPNENPGIWTGGFQSVAGHYNYVHNSG